MRHGLLVCVIFAVGVAACRSLPDPDALRLYDLSQGRTRVGQEALDGLQGARIVLVGEQHTNDWHHQAQLAVIRALQRSGVQVAIGLEMFRHERQGDLDQWVAGEIDESAFIPLYLENWNYDWAFYRPIFLYARDHRIPMIGLNVSREISRQVAHHGFGSLTPAQRGVLNDIACEVTPAYREFIRHAHDAHAHGRMDFDHFCQAQLLWDASMALYALQYLTDNDERIMVLLAGSGHARKMGIPAQLSQRAPLPAVVVLPETPGVFEKGRVTATDADFLLMAP
jgi:uncharacterized iron-regulated protein